ncbi:hypothetical protein AVEN_47686-1 [Araneus ventricosus]|uniref:Uncharacterized protein n=1 Tax=Araneus ventricosus TaxID=182803 RepID=A0A4Y2MYG2_ARAVE|nr:hypothetical protein AVEN_47686-1 [Araneus ventricosus]
MEGLLARRCQGPGTVSAAPSAYLWVQMKHPPFTSAQGTQRCISAQLRCNGSSLPKCDHFYCTFYSTDPFRKDGISESLTA